MRVTFVRNRMIYHLSGFKITEKIIVSPPTRQTPAQPFWSVSGSPNMKQKKIRTLDNGVVLVDFMDERQQLQLWLPLLTHLQQELVLQDPLDRLDEQI